MNTDRPMPLSASSGMKQGYEKSVILDAQALVHSLCAQRTNQEKRPQGTCHIPRQIARKGHKIKHEFCAYPFRTTFLGACASGGQRQSHDNDYISSASFALLNRTFKCRERMDAQERSSAVKGSLS